MARIRCAESGSSTKLKRADLWRPASAGLPAFRNAFRLCRARVKFVLLIDRSQYSKHTIGDFEANRAR